MAHKSCRSLSGGCCGNDVTWTNNFNGLSDGCGATGTALVVFTATDACGNTTTSSATFRLRILPAFYWHRGKNSTVQCDGAGNIAARNAWLSTQGGASASDACSGVTWSNNFTALSPICGATGSATVISLLLMLVETLQLLRQHLQFR